MSLVSNQKALLEKVHTRQKLTVSFNILSHQVSSYLSIKSHPAASDHKQETEGGSKRHADNL